MTTTLKPHDFYIKLSEFADKKIRKADSEELEYLTSILDKWDKCRFAETNELSFAYLRNWAIDNAPDADLMKEIVQLVDSHVEENITSLFPAHGVNIRKTIGMPEPVEESAISK